MAIRKALEKLRTALVSLILILVMIMEVIFALAMGACTWLGIGDIIRKCFGMEFLKTEIGILMFCATGVFAYIIVSISLIYLMFRKLNKKFLK